MSGKSPSFDWAPGGDLRLGAAARRPLVLFDDNTIGELPDGSVVLKGALPSLPPVPVAPGTIQYFAFDPGAGWLKCDTAVYLRSSYADLTMLPDAPSNVFSALTSPLAGKSIVEIIAHPSGRWVAFGGERVSYSDDAGDTWTNQNVSDGWGIRGAATDGAGTYVFASYGDFGISTNWGTTWTVTRPANFPGNWLRWGGGTTWFGNGGTAGQPAYTEDNGATWTLCAVDHGSGTPSCGLYAGGMWFAGTQNGGLYASNNKGATWSAGIANMEGFPFLAPQNRFVKSRTGIVMLAAGNTLARSRTNAYFWERPMQPTLASPGYSGLATDHRGVWLAGGSSGLLARSVDDGLTWQELVSGFGAGVTISAIAEENGSWILCGSDGSMRRCVDDSTRFITPYLPGAWVKT